MNPPLVTGVLQVAVVVKDLDQAVRNYTDNFGIGPWSIYTIRKSQRDMVVNDEPTEYSFRMALGKIGQINWELIQPLDETTTFAEFLREHGEGVHHICFEAPDSAALTARSRELSPKSIGVLGAGTWDGVQGSLRYTYLDTADQLGVIAEYWASSDDFVQPSPDVIYPNQAFKADRA